MSLLTPLIVGIAGVSGYMIKRNKNCVNAFNNFNSELSEDSLPDRIIEAYKVQQDIDSKIESKIREISTLGSQLQERKRIMESFSEDSDEEAQIIEAEKEDTIPGCSQEDLISLDHGVFSGVEKEHERETKGLSLVLRRKFNNTQQK